MACRHGPGPRPGAALHRSLPGGHVVQVGASQGRRAGAMGLVLLWAACGCCLPAAGPPGLPPAAAGSTRRPLRTFPCSLPPLAAWLSAPCGCSFWRGSWGWTVRASHGCVGRPGVQGRRARLQRMLPQGPPPQLQPAALRPPLRCCSRDPCAPPRPAGPGGTARHAGARAAAPAPQRGGDDGAGGAQRRPSAQVRPAPEPAPVPAPCAWCALATCPVCMGVALLPCLCRATPTPTPRASCPPMAGWCWATRACCAWISAPTHMPPSCSTFGRSWR